MASPEKSIKMGKIFLLVDNAPGTRTVTDILRKKAAEEAAREIQKLEKTTAKDFTVYKGKKHQAPSIVLTGTHLDEFVKRYNVIKNKYERKEITFVYPTL